ncbi:hypothetical protein [Mucilaginibacter sp.]|uniref:hypothetical protein n=1 Tax=Mucilaginibacter sp. TaxID=1882438 RepID=UPI0032650257
MIQAITFPNRIQQYNMLARRWIAELNFFNIETAFLKSQLDVCIIRLSDQTFAERLRIAIKKITKLEEDKKYSDYMLNDQFEISEQIGEELLHENESALASKQMELDYLMRNFNVEYCEVKTELFLLIKTISLQNKQLTGN